MPIFEFIINFIHSIAASVWLGGCFLMITLSMSQKFKLIENYQSIFQNISFSLRELVNGSMILIFLTGIIMTIQKLSLVQKKCRTWLNLNTIKRVDTLDS